MSAANNITKIIDIKNDKIKIVTTKIYVVNIIDQNHFICTT